jgi:hypothetical protein
MPKMQGKQSNRKNREYQNQLVQPDRYWVTLKLTPILHRPLFKVTIQRDIKGEDMKRLMLFFTAIFVIFLIGLFTLIQTDEFANSKPIHEAGSNNNVVINSDFDETFPLWTFHCRILEGRYQKNFSDLKNSYPRFAVSNPFVLMDLIHPVECPDLTLKLYPEEGPALKNSFDYQNDIYPDMLDDDPLECCA